MIYEYKIGEQFDYLAQRVVYAYMVSYTKFQPIYDDEASEEAQKQIHSFFNEVLYNIYNNPTLIDLDTASDDFYNGEAYKDKPELNEAMKKLEKKFLSFFGYLFELGDVGTVIENKLHILKTNKKITKSKLVQLKQIGLKYELTKEATIIYNEIYPKLFSGWKLLCNVCKQAEGKDNIINPVIAQSLTRLMFMRCIFDKGHISWTSLYGDLEQSGPFLKELEDFFINNEYSNKFFDASFSLQKTYANKQVGAFNIKFNWRSKNQLEYSIVVPGFRLLMNHFDEMNEELKELILARTGNCRNCGYCTQTDKTGKRKPVAVQIEYHEEIVDKCPLYPYLAWNKLNENTVSIIKDLFTYAVKTI